ncbi:keratin, type I cytoskeletal 10-like [Calliphora vicina]|uniref:keratin, type I cytoskeletal 10-like n=1 Tax=Calliphora vicina TaxID=7373 RepID=UPI00325ADDE2
MKIFVLTLAVLATGASALNSQYLPPHQSSGGSFGGFGSGSVGHAAVVQPSYSVGHSGGFSSGGSFGGFGAGSISHGVAAQPSRQYLAPAASSSHGVSTGFSSGGSSFGGLSGGFPSGGSSFGGHSGGFSSGGSFGGFGAASTGHAIAAKPSRQYLAPAASTAHVVSAGFPSGGSSFGGHSGGFSSGGSSFGGLSSGLSSGGSSFGGSSFGGFAAPSNQYLAPAASTHHAVSTGFSGGHSAGTRYGTNGGYEYRHRHRA